MPRRRPNYDYGLRGRRDTSFRPHPQALPRGYGYGYDYNYDLVPARFGRPLPHHVTARYNMDYVIGNRGDRYPRNYNAFTGDREDRVGDLRYYRRAYTTIGGTHTLRGASWPTGYDYDYYGGYDRDYSG